MKRSIALAVTFLFAATMAAHAQARPDASTEPARAGTTNSGSATTTNSTNVFSKTSIEKAVASASASVPTMRSSSKPIYKRTWPYVVAAIIIALVVIF